MYKKLEFAVLEKACEDEDSSARDDCRKEVLEYFDRELENAKTMIFDLKKDIEQIELIINEENETSDIKSLVDEKWLMDLYRIQWELVLELLENLNVGYRKKWGYEVTMELVGKEKIMYLLESVKCIKDFIDGIEQENED